MPSVRIAIAGATGYAGEELLRLLLQHPHVRLSYLAGSAKWARATPLDEVFPRFARPGLPSIEPLDAARLIASCDAAFLAMPHGGSMPLVPQLLDAGKRVIDLSADFRLRDASLYPRWYQKDHPCPELLTAPQTVYGLTEFHRDALPAARLVANPGCYATSILLALVPVYRAGLVEDAPVMVDAKSGLSGAGRKADEALLFTEMAENLRAYKVNQHQHMPEIAQELQQLTGTRLRMVFVPQVLPIIRGMISMIYVRSKATMEQVMRAYREAYPAPSPFVRVRAGALPQVKDVVGTNQCAIGVVHDPEQQTFIIASAIDNLTKGAAGQAVQNFNLMHGFPETLGLS